MQKLLTVRMASDLLNRHPNTIARWIQDNMFPNASRIRRGWFIPENDVRRLLKDGCCVPVKLWTDSLVSWMQKPTELIQNPSQQKTVEALSIEPRASEPGFLVRSRDSKRAGFSVKRAVNNVQQTGQKLSGAGHLC